MKKSDKNFKDYMDSIHQNMIEERKEYKEYFCSCGNQFNKDKVSYFAHERFRGDLPSFGIVICPSCGPDRSRQVGFVISENEML